MPSLSTTVRVIPVSTCKSLSLFIIRLPCCSYRVPTIGGNVSRVLLQSASDPTKWKHETTLSSLVETGLFDFALDSSRPIVPHSCIHCVRLCLLANRSPCASTKSIYVYQCPRGPLCVDLVHTLPCREWRAGSLLVKRSYLKRTYQTEPVCDLVFIS
jgi:hypothetical protein